MHNPCVCFIFYKQAGSVPIVLSPSLPVFLCHLYISAISGWKLKCIEIWWLKTITSQCSLSQNPSCQLFIPYHIVWSYSYDEDEYMLGDMLGCPAMISVFSCSLPHSHKTWKHSPIFNNHFHPRHNSPKSSLNLGLDLRFRSGVQSTNICVDFSLSHSKTSRHTKQEKKHQRKQGT